MDSILNLKKVILGVKTDFEVDFLRRLLFENCVGGQRFFDLKKSTIPRL
jgi:hypothetical protein